MTKPDTPPAKTPDPLTTLATLAGEVVEATEAAAIGVLEAELAVLKSLGKPVPPPDEAGKEAARRAEEAAVEDGFDNMPV